MLYMYIYICVYVLVKQIGNDFEIMISRVLCVSMCVSFYWVKLVSDIWLIFYYIHFLFCILIFRKHTVALAPESGRVYAFGLGACGQLGFGNTINCTSPVVTKGPWLSALQSTMNNTGRNIFVTKMVAGGDHCFVLASTSDVSEENKFVKFPYS